MNKPSQNTTKTWITTVISDKCFSKGNFSFHYTCDTIDNIWSRCAAMPTPVRNLLYSMQVTTKLNPTTKLTGVYTIVFHCDGRIAEQVVKAISEYLDYSNIEGHCVFNLDKAIKGIGKSIKVPIKKMVLPNQSKCFDSSDDDNDHDDDVDDDVDVNDIEAEFTNN